MHCRIASFISRTARSMPTSTARRDDAVADVQLLDAGDAHDRLHVAGSSARGPCGRAGPSRGAWRGRRPQRRPARARPPASLRLGVARRLDLDRVGPERLAPRRSASRSGSMNSDTSMPAACSRSTAGRDRRLVGDHVEPALGRQLLPLLRHQRRLVRLHLAGDADDLVGGGHLQVEPRRRPSRAGRARRGPGCGGGPRAGGR